MEKTRKLAIFFGDIALLYLALATMLLVRYGPALFVNKWEGHLAPFSLIFIAWIFSFYAFGLYGYKIDKGADLARNIFFAVLFAGLVSVAIFYFFANFFHLTPKTNIVVFGVLVFVFKYFWQKIVLFKLFAKETIKVMLVGNSMAITKTALFIKDNPHVGYEITAWFDEPESLESKKLIEKLKSPRTDTVVIQEHLVRGSEVAELLHGALVRGVNVMSFWAFYETIFEKVPLEEIEESWLLANIVARKPLYDAGKRILDIVLAFMILIVFLPVVALCALMVKTTSEGPVIYKQKRTGRSGEVFTLYKLRTMRKDAEADGPKWSGEKDGRVTAVGKILRRTHLDELPQLVNILKGDLSFVGPRPERPEFVEELKKEIPFYSARHAVKPGLTGWAQIRYRYGSSTKDAYEKLQYDLYYIKKRNLFLDIMITVKTIKAVFIKL